MKTRLYASCLWSKFGFEDGDAMASRKELVEAVRTHLLPAIAQAGHVIEVEEICTSHNPIRIEGESGYAAAPAWAYKLYVEV